MQVRARYLRILHGCDYKSSHACKLGAKDAPRARIDRVVTGRGDRGHVHLEFTPIDIFLAPRLPWKSKCHVDRRRVDTIEEGERSKKNEAPRMLAPPRTRSARIALDSLLLTTRSLENHASASHAALTHTGPALRAPFAVWIAPARFCALAYRTDIALGLLDGLASAAFFRPSHTLFFALLQNRLPQVGGCKDHIPGFGIADSTRRGHCFLTRTKKKVAFPSPSTLHQKPGHIRERLSAIASASTGTRMKR